MSRRTASRITVWRLQEAKRTLDSQGSGLAVKAASGMPATPTVAAVRSTGAAMQEASPKGLDTQHGFCDEEVDNQARRIAESGNEGVRKDSWVRANCFSHDGHEPAYCC